MDECADTTCDCGWCGRCAQQLEHERYVQNLRGYGIPSWEGEQNEYFELARNHSDDES